MAEFRRADMSGSRFEQVDLSNATFRMVDLANAEFRGVNMRGAVLRGVEMVDVDIYGEIVNVTINGVDVRPLIDAELNRRYPDRAKMSPDDPDGFREAWAILERLWRGTVHRARRLSPELLHESVDGEWSFIETLRHLSFATDAWVRRAVLGDPSPWDPPDLPWDEMPDMPGIPRDREVRAGIAQLSRARVFADRAQLGMGTPSVCRTRSCRLGIRKIRCPPDGSSVERAPVPALRSRSDSVGLTAR